MLRLENGEGSALIEDNLSQKSEWDIESLKRSE
jgi:hypothetical protein